MFIIMRTKAFQDQIAKIDSHALAIVIPGQKEVAIL